MIQFNGDPAVDLYVNLAGSDNNSGRSTATPLATIAAALVLAALITIPVNIWLNKGDNFVERVAPPTGLKIGAYGTGAAPTISGYHSILGTPGVTWTSIGSNKWTNVTAASPDRLSASGVMATFNNGNPSLSVASGSVTSDGKFNLTFNAGTSAYTFTVYAPSDPATYYSSIRFTYQYCVFGSGVSNVTIDGVKLTGGYRGIQANSCSNWYVNNVETYRNASQGTAFQVTGASNSIVNGYGHENGLGPTQGCCGFFVGAGDGIGQPIYNTVLLNCISNLNGEDAFQIGLAGNTYSAKLINCSATDNFENSIDVKGGLIYMWNFLGDQSPTTIATQYAATFHVLAPEIYMWDCTFKSMTTANSLSAGMAIQEGAFVHAVRCYIQGDIDRAVDIQSTSTGSSDFTACLFEKLRSDGTHSITILSVNGTGAHTLKQCTLASPLDATVKIQPLQILGAGGASVTSTNSILSTATNSTSAYIVDRIAVGSYSSTNDLLWKGGATTNWIKDAGTNKSKAQVQAGLTGITAAVTADPLFTDPTTHNYIPQSTSPAKAAGAASGIYADINNVAYLTPQPIGAYNTA